MKIIMKYILTNVKERRTRTAVMLLSVILSSALLFVSCSISASYESAQRKMARGISGSAAAVVRPAGESGSIDGALIPDLPSVGAKAGILKGSSVYYESGYYAVSYTHLDVYKRQIIHMEPIKPEENLAEKALQFFCTFTEQNGRAKAVRYRNPWIAAALKETCQYFGTKLTKSSLGTMDKMIQMMREQM